MNIITGPDGSSYIQFDGAVTVRPSTFDGEALMTFGSDVPVATYPSAYTLDDMFAMQSSRWGYRGFGVARQAEPPPPPQPPQPHGRFRHLDWE